MEHNISKKKILCTNCGKHGHEFRFCSEPISSFGIINIRICDDVNESLVIKEKFSIINNTFYQILSRKYPMIKCCITDNITLYDSNPNTGETTSRFNSNTPYEPNRNTSYEQRNVNSNTQYEQRSVNSNISYEQSRSYVIDNNSIPYYSEDDLKKFNYYKNKVMFLMISRKFSLGFVEFIRGRYDVVDTKTIINLFEQMTTNEIELFSGAEYDDILYLFLNRTNESKEVVLNRIYEGEVCYRIL